MNQAKGDDDNLFLLTLCSCCSSNDENQHLLDRERGGSVYCNRF